MSVQQSTWQSTSSMHAVLISTGHAYGSTLFSRSRNAVDDEEHSENCVVTYEEPSKEHSVKYILFE